MHAREQTGKFEKKGRKNRTHAWNMPIECHVLFVPIWLTDWLALIFLSVLHRPQETKHTEFCSYLFVYVFMTRLNTRVQTKPKHEGRIDAK